MKSFLRTTILVAVSSLVALAEQEAKPSVSITLLERYKGKGHGATVDLIATNPTEQAAWLVIGYFSNERLPKTGNFLSGRKNKEAFEASEYKEEKGSGIIVNHYGKDHFKAIFLPAKGSIRFKKFVLEDGKFIREHEFMIVSRLLVNGKTPLEDWMPYDVKSSRETVIEGRLYSGDQEILSWHHENTTKDPKPYPKEPVRSIAVENTLFRKVFSFEGKEK